MHKTVKNEQCRRDQIKVKTVHHNHTQPGYFEYLGNDNWVLSNRGVGHAKLPSHGSSEVTSLSPKFAKHYGCVEVVFWYGWESMANAAVHQERVITGRAVSSSVAYKGSSH